MKKFLLPIIGLAVVVILAWKKGWLGSAQSSKATVDSNLGTRPAPLPGTYAQQRNSTKNIAQSANDYIGLANTGITTLRGLFGGSSSSTGTRSANTSGGGTGVISQQDYEDNNSWSENLVSQSEGDIESSKLDNQSSDDDVWTDSDF